MQNQKKATEDLIAETMELRRLNTLTIRLIDCLSRGSSEYKVRYDKDSKPVGIDFTVEVSPCICSAEMLVPNVVVNQKEV